MNTQQLFAESVDAFIVGFNTTRATKPQILTDEAKACFLMTSELVEEYDLDEDAPIWAPFLGKSSVHDLLSDLTDEGADEYEYSCAVLSLMAYSVTFCKLHVPTGVVFIEEVPYLELSNGIQEGIEHQSNSPGVYAALQVANTASTQTHDATHDHQVEYHRLAVKQGELVHYTSSECVTLWTRSAKRAGKRVCDLYHTVSKPFSVSHVAGPKFMDEDGELYKLTQLMDSDGLFMVRDYTELYKNPVADDNGFLLERS